MSTSAPGSTKGKNEGRKRTARAPNSALRKLCITPLRWAKEMPSSTHSPSIWWNIGEWVASESQR
jgi:hypothetical protein